MSNDNKKYSRLNHFIRKSIETLLDAGKSFTKIAGAIGVSVTTVSRKTKRNRTIICNTSSYKCEGERCSACKKVRCNQICKKFEMIICEKLRKAPLYAMDTPRNISAVLRNIITSLQMHKKKLL